MMIIYNDLTAGQKKAIKHIFVWGLLAAALLVLAVAFYYGTSAIKNYQSVRDDGTFPLSVSGEGTVYASPDVATVNLTVRTQATLLKDASSDNNNKNNKVIAFLKSKSVDGKDIKTTAYNVTPQYQYDNRPCPLRSDVPCPAQMPPKIAGYEVSNSVRVKVRNLDMVGAILDGAVTAGANDISGPNFTVDDPDKAKEEARALALNQAKTKAKTLAGAMGVRLIKISGFSESGSSPIYYGLEKSMSADMAPSAPIPTIEPGQNEIKVTVTVTYDAK
ncbi:MAG: SIMPL domain-containing protein [bacterium]|nr:SIMPL domain-containing protein [bacterium]